MTCFYDPCQLVFYDPDHGQNEYREIMVAHSNIGNILFISYTLRNETIRLISARKATKREVRDYEKALRH